MSLLRSFLRDSVIYAVPTLISRGLSLFLVPLYTRVLSPIDYGSLDLLMVFAGFVNLTVALEVSQGVARYYVSEQDAERKILYASTAFWFTVFCYTLFLILALIFSTGLSRFVMGAHGLESIFRIGMIYIWLNGVSYLIQNQFRWELRSNSYAVVSLLVTCVTAAVTVTLSYILSWGLAGILYGLVAGALVGCVYGLWYLRNTFRFRFQTDRLTDMLRFSAPLVPSGIAVFVSLYVDRLMINHFLSLDEVGVYGIGFRVASTVGLVMVGFQSALTPLVYVHYREKQTPQQLALIFRLFLVSALLIFLFLSLFAKEIMQLITTSAYYSAATVVIYLVPAILLSNMYIFAPGIAIAKKTHLILYINVGGAVLNAAFNWLLIPQLGIAGAALATLLGYACVFAAYMSISQRLYFVPHQWRPLGLSVAGVTALAFLIPPLNLSASESIAVKALALMGACVLFIMAGLVQSSELRHVRTLLAERFGTVRQ